MVAHRRHLRGALEFHCRCGRRSHGRSPRYGTPVSYDLNFRDSLWSSIGGKAKAQDVNRELVRKVDLLLGNEEDFSAMLGVEIKGVSEDFDELPIAAYEEMLREVAAAYPNLKLIASTLRTARTASRNAWGAIALYEDKIVHVPQQESTSSTASGAAIVSLPGSSTDFSPASRSTGPFAAESLTAHWP